MSSEYSVNKRDQVVLTTFAYTAGFPTKLRLRDLALQIEGTTGPNTWCGIYGTSSTRQATFTSYHNAEQRGLLSLQVRSWCRLRDLGVNSGTAIARDTVQRTGFLDTRRAVPRYRDELRESILPRLADSVVHDAFAKLSKLSLGEILLLHPESTAWILQTEPDVELLVHQARLCGSPNAEVVNVGTVRTSTAKAMQSLVVCAEERVSVRY